MSEYSKAQAENILDNIIELLEMVDKAEDYYPEEDDILDEIDDIFDEIHELPLEVSVRTGWTMYPDEKPEWVEYRVIMSTGGPAVTITGKLGAYNTPVSVRLMHADNHEEWQYYFLNDYEREKLLEFADYFYYGV